MWGRTARAKRVQLQRSVTHKSESDMPSQQKVEMSDLAMANVEALANDEDFNLDDFNDNCYWYQDKDCYYLIVSPDGNTVWWHSNFEERF